MDSNAQYETRIYSTEEYDEYDLLELGRLNINDAIREDGWIQPQISFPLRFSATASFYEYALRPPKIKSKQPSNVSLSEDLKPWGAPVTSDEIFDIKTLEPYIVRRKRKKQKKLPALVPMNTDPMYLPNSKPMIEPPLELKRSPKRKRMEPSWSELLPKPHTYEYQLPRIKPPSGLRSITPYHYSYILSKQAPVFIQDRYSIATWLIPVHGVLEPPVVRNRHSQLLSPARFVDPSELPPSRKDSPAKKKASTPEIIWTPLSLTEFWDFLVLVRSEGGFGSMGLTYSIESTSCVYIQVGCDAIHAMRVRRLLSSWYAPQEESFERSFPVGSLRLLRYTELILLDSFGKGMLIA